MKCKVCGRDKEELEGEFEIEIDFKEHQGITKCSKCIREYETETSAQETSSDDSMEVKDWKKEIFA